MKKLIFTFSFLVVGANLLAQATDLNQKEFDNLTKANSFIKQQKSAFEENKGQVTGEEASKVRYTYNVGNLSVFLMEKGIAYQFKRIHYPEGYQHSDKFASPENQEKIRELKKDIRTETYRMDVELLGANSNAIISAEGKSSDYVQYYNHDALGVYSYTKVIYHNVYPNIDWVIYTKGNDLEYDFVVRPGGNPSQIQLKTKWVEELSLTEKGDMIYKNRLGSICEQAPKSFQNNKEIITQFDINKGIISFNIENYNLHETLIIDPLVSVRDWGTYCGGPDQDYGSSCAVDGSGNIYIAGSTSSSSDIASGGYQNVYGGGSRDVFLMKFSTSGTRQWGSYYGGSDDDYCFGYSYSCAIDGSNNVYLTGITSSTNAIASGGWQNTYGGGTSDAFLVKFNSSGVRQWGTYFGGTVDDYSNSCVVDASGNIYLAGRTSSTSSIASGGHQSTFGGGLGDAFLVKFNSSGVRQWGTYYGGTNLDFGTSCDVDASGNVYLSGNTYSYGSIASGGFQNTYGGSGSNGGDAFLVKFNSAGVRQWGTYYGGTDTDNSYGCLVDASGNVYLVGATGSTTSVSSGGYQNTFGGGNSDAFLAKFNSSGSRQWGTYYGGNGSDYGYYCNIDASGNIYIGGTTTSSSQIASGGHQNVIGGNQDAFLVKLNSSGARQWATYYGGTDEDYGASCAVDVSGNIYLAGSCYSTNAIALGGYQNSYGGNEDAFLVKFQECISGNNTTSTTAICENGNKTLSSTSSGGTWSVVSGGGTISGNTYTPNNVTSNTNVTVRYTDACGNNSDVTFVVNVYNAANNTTSTAPICEGSTKTLVGSPAGGTWSVISGGGNISGTTYTSPSVSTNTNVVVRYSIAANGSCSGSTDNVAFTVNNNPEAASNTTSTAAICESTNKTLVGTPSGGTWSIVSGYGSISGSTYTSPDIGSTVTVRYTIPDNGACTGSSSDVTFVVNDNPGAFYSYDAIGLSVQFNSLSVGATSYSWNFGDGGTAASPSPVHNYLSDGTYTVELSVTGPCGTDLFYKNITVADSLNSSDVGVEDKSEMSFSIYPNPANEFVTISYELEKASSIEAKLISIDGKEVRKLNLSSLSKGSFSIDLMGLEAGVYLLKLEVDDNEIVKHIVKQ